MIGSDVVALAVAPQLDIGIDSTGNLIGGPARSFLFSDLVNGRFLAKGDIVYENLDVGAPKKAGWELV